MITEAICIEQPISGMFQERIYDIESPWNSDKWTWIKFTEEEDCWCGEFRGKYRGVACSESLGISLVLTSDYLYLLDNVTHEIIDSERQPQYIDLIATPEGEIFIATDYEIDRFVGDSLKNMERIVMPFEADSIRFKNIEGGIIRINCYEFLKWEEQLELSYDYKNNRWMK